jgi:hypothetical protein
MPGKIFDIDLGVCTLKDLEFEAKFDLEVLHTGA